MTDMTDIRVEPVFCPECGRQYGTVTTTREIDIAAFTTGKRPSAEYVRVVRKDFSLQPHFHTGGDAMTAPEQCPYCGAFVWSRTAIDTEYRCKSIYRAGTLFRDRRCYEAEIARLKARVAELERERKVTPWLE